MAQFTPESLARLLTQVEREVLVEAAEAAAIDPLLTTPRGETLDEVAEWLNFLSNMLVLAPAIDAIATEETVKRMMGITTFLPPGALKGMRGLLGFFTDLMEKVGVIQDSIDAIEFPESSQQIDVPAILAITTQISDDMATLDRWNRLHASSNVLNGIAVNTTQAVLAIRRLL